MKFIYYFNKKTFKYDLINKYLYKNIKELPTLKKIILNFGYKNNDIKNLATGLIALQLISKQRGILTKTKNANALLKIRKGSLVGCKVVLRNQIMLLFLSKFLVEITPKIKNFEGFKLNKETKKTFSYNLNDILLFDELEKNYYLFNNLPKLNITLVTTDLTTEKEFVFLLNSFKFPLKK